MAPTLFSLEVRPRLTPPLERGRDLAAYFCMEYGLREDLRLYSGGLGILAGDHCKGAADLGLPFVAVGLLFRQGYFDQTIDAEGVQHDSYPETDFSSLPLERMAGTEGDLRVRVQVPGREVMLQLWKLQLRPSNQRRDHDPHPPIDLVLLDSNLDENSDDDRQITWQLYGGDQHMRILQEVCLGVGGVRALRAAGLDPSAWHINEGHAAFLILERIRELVAQGCDFDTALEAVAGATLFTTHTPVPAGHDFFHLDEIRPHLEIFAGQLGVPVERILELGHNLDRENGLNMTSLALRGSRFHNGVSRIHGGVAANMESYIWPEIPPQENPLSSVTNGIHLETFLAPEWRDTFDRAFGDTWRRRKIEAGFWARIHDLADAEFWQAHQSAKRRLLQIAQESARRRGTRNGQDPQRLAEATRLLDPDRPDILTIGFARRFTAYKRATLLFRDLDRVVSLLSSDERPVVVIFAGKAHPRDDEGREIMRQIHAHAESDALRGRVILLEGYDLALGRALVSGCDVWLNTPRYPLEASGTSGQKAGVNGVLNLSVLDGWWPEGYAHDNGWAITPAYTQDRHIHDDNEARQLMDLLEQRVVPLYYDRDEAGISGGWVQMSKHAIERLLPKFNAERMVREYADRFYAAASAAGRTLAADDYAPAGQLAAWKRRVREAWPGVSLRLAADPEREIAVGEKLALRVQIDLGELAPEDVTIECLLSDTDPDNSATEPLPMNLAESAGNGTHLFTLDFPVAAAGPLTYRIRVYPTHEHLQHRFEMGLMRWL